MSERICLVVDDEPALRTYLSAILRRRGMQSLEAGSAAKFHFRPKAIHPRRNHESRRHGSGPFMGGAVVASGRGILERILPGGQDVFSDLAA